MIEMSELNPHGYNTTPEIDDNLHVLHTRVNKIRDAWGKPMTVTSGLRSEADQARINPSATKSKHLIGAACDIADADGSLKQFVKDNLQLLIDAELWCEDFEHTKTWAHFQIFPPKSGKRFFIP